MKFLNHLYIPLFLVLSVISAKGQTSCASPYSVPGLPSGTSSAPACGAVTNDFANVSHTASGTANLVPSPGCGGYSNGDKVI